MKRYRFALREKTGSKARLMQNAEDAKATSLAAADLTLWLSEMGAHIVRHDARIGNSGA